MHTDCDLLKEIIIFIHVFILWDIHIQSNKIFKKKLTYEGIIYVGYNDPRGQRTVGVAVTPAITAAREPLPFPIEAGSSRASHDTAQQYFYIDNIS